MDTTSNAQQIAAVLPPDRVRVVATPGVRGGKPRVDGHRVTVADIDIWHERQGLDPDEIADRHPTLTLSDVHAALAYYFENRDRVDADILEGERLAEQLRAGVPRARAGQRRP